VETKHTLSVAGGLTETRKNRDSAMKQPCGEAVVRSGSSDTLCRTQSRAWVLAATILGSSMAFIDSTVVNVALARASIQSSRNGRRRQWVVESYGLFLSTLLLIGGHNGRFRWPPFYFLTWSGSIRRGLGWVRSFFEHCAVNCRTLCPGYWRRISGPQQSRNYQCVLR